MAFHLPIVFLACLAIAIAQYTPYSPHPPANARDPTLSSKPSSTYNRAQDFRAAGTNPGYRSMSTLPSRQGSYGQQQGQLNGNSAYHSGSASGAGAGYNGELQRAAAFRGQQEAAMGYGPMGDHGSASYNGGAGAFDGDFYENGLRYGGQQDGSYDDLAQPSPDDPDGDSIVGVAGSDYPTYVEVPMTSFHCSQQQFPGFYADVEAQCQVFHICQDGGQQDSFLCPNGSIFNQKYFVCDWWYNVDCQSSPSFYGLNADLYKDVSRYSAAASYAANLPSGGHSFANGQGPSAAYGPSGRGPASSVYGNDNGVGSGGPASGYGNGRGNGRAPSAYGNGRVPNGVSPSSYGSGAGRGISGASSAYGRDNGRQRSETPLIYGNGNGRGSSGIPAYDNRNGMGRPGSASAYGNGNGRENAVASSVYGNGNGRGHSGTSAAYGNGNGRGSTGVASSYGNGRGSSGTSASYGNGRGSSGTSASYGNGRGSSGTSASYGNGRGSSGTSASYGNGRGNSGTSASYGNGNGRGHSGASSVYSNGRGRSGISTYGNGNGSGRNGPSTYGNGNARGPSGTSSYGNGITASGPRHTSQNANKQSQNDDYSIVDMPPIGY